MLVLGILYGCILSYFFFFFKIPSVYFFYIQWTLWGSSKIKVKHRVAISFESRWYIYFIQTFLFSLYLNRTAIVLFDCKPYCTLIYFIFIEYRITILKEKIFLSCFQTHSFTNTRRTLMCVCVLYVTIRDCIVFILKFLLTR